MPFTTGELQDSQVFPSVRQRQTELHRAYENGEINPL